MKTSPYVAFILKALAKPCKVGEIPESVIEIAGPLWHGAIGEAARSAVQGRRANILAGCQGAYEGLDKGVYAGATIPDVSDVASDVPVNIDLIVLPADCDALAKLILALLIKVGLFLPPGPFSFLFPSPPLPPSLMCFLSFTLPRWLCGCPGRGRVSRLD